MRWWLLEASIAMPKECPLLINCELGNWEDAKLWPTSIPEDIQSYLRPPGLFRDIIWGGSYMDSIWLLLTGYYFTNSSCCTIWCLYVLARWSLLRFKAFWPLAWVHNNCIGQKQCCHSNCMNCTEIISATAGVGTCTMGTSTQIFCGVQNNYNLWGSWLKKISVVTVVCIQLTHQQLLHGL